MKCDCLSPSSSYFFHLLPPPHLLSVCHFLLSLRSPDKRLKRKFALWRRRERGIENISTRSQSVMFYDLRCKDREREMCLVCRKMRKMKLYFYSNIFSSLFLIDAFRRCSPSSLTERYRVQTQAHLLYMLLMILISFGANHITFNTRGWLIARDVIWGVIRESRWGEDRK